jgi:2-polyprenyl-3-methyl-5-hydroxy-6-metoxy-1,4-benzoquinol methylase
MPEDELKRVETASHWYLKDQLNFDKRLIGLRYQTLKPHIQGPEGLELGPAEGSMTRYLVGDFERLTIVDGAAQLLERIPAAPNLTKVHSLFEDFHPAQRFNTIVMEHILEHVDDPVALLARVKGWAAPQGKLLLGVPNGNSIHRLVAVKMGLLKDPCELNDRDHAVGHRRVYTRESFRRDIEKAGLKVLEMNGVLFKPLSNQQIQDHWTEEMIQGFYELGKDFPEYAAEISAVCVVP